MMVTSVSIGMCRSENDCVYVLCAAVLSLSRCYTANRNFTLLLFCIYAVVAEVSICFVIANFSIFVHHLSSDMVSFIYLTVCMRTYQPNTHRICVHLSLPPCVCVYMSSCFTFIWNSVAFVMRQREKKIPMFFMWEVLSIECSDFVANTMKSNE